MRFRTLRSTLSSIDTLFVVFVISIALFNTHFAQASLVSGIFEKQEALAFELLESELNSGDLKRSLLEILGRLQDVDQFIEKMDKPRLLVLISMLNQCLGVVDQYPAGHAKILENLRRLALTFQFSSSYFQLISGDLTAKSISLAQEKMQNDIVAKYGIAESYFTKNVRDLFSQMKLLTDQIMSMDASLELRKAVTDLRSQHLGPTIAIAELGDRPKAYARANAAHAAITKLYPLFYQITSSQSLFKVVMEIQGLNELYSEISQMARD